MFHKFYKAKQNVPKKLAKNPELPNKLKSLSHSGSGEIDQGRAVFIRDHLEKASLPISVDFLVSHHFLEHVVDLDGFYQACLKILKPGGIRHTSLTYSAAPTRRSNFTIRFSNIPKIDV